MTSKRELTPDYIGHIGGVALVALSQGTTSTPETLESIEKKLTTINYVWNPNTLVYDVMTQPSTGGAGAGSTTTDANLTSAGSTRLVGQFTVANPTTAVTVSNPTTSVSLSAGSSSNMIGAVAQGAGSTSVAPWYVISTAAAGAGSTTVDANLTSAGSTRVIGTVGVSSGVILGAGSSANTLGSVALVAGTSANVVGSVTLSAGTTANSIGSVALVAGSSANTIGAVAQGPSSTANYWFMLGLPFSSGGTSRTSVSTTIDIQIVAANANRKAMVVANRSTVQTVGLGFSTAVLTTALANVDLFLGPSAQLVFGPNGELPLYTGPMRGLNLTSTTVAGSVSVIQFTT